mgnify:FL=1
MPAIQSLNREEYDALNAINWSRLKNMAVSPRHYQHALAAPRVETDAMRLGTATHCAVFEPDEFPRRFVLWDGGRRYGKEWNAFQEQHANEVILREDDYTTALAIRDAVRAHPVARQYMASGAAEQVLTWTDSATGLDLKGRTDWISGDPAAVVDLKTTAKGVGPREFAITVARSLYHGQMSYYRTGVKAATGRDASAILIAVENAAPYDCAVYELDDDCLYAGEKLVAGLLAKLAECQRVDRWPGQSERLEFLALLAWAFPREEN